MTFFSRKHLRLLLLPALLLLTGCAGSAKETADSTENEKLSAVATIFPQYDFLRAIGGDHLDLHMLLSPGAESHSFEPTPGDMITVSECDLFVYVGGDSDAWVETILDSVDTSNKEVVTLMDCVDTVAEETVEGMETHGHAHDHEDEDADHEDEHHDEDESHGEQDEHVWTSPKNAMRIVQKLCDALCRLDPENADDWQTLLRTSLRLPPSMRNFPMSPQTPAAIRSFSATVSRSAISRMPTVSTTTRRSPAAPRNPRRAPKHFLF